MWASLITPLPFLMLSYWFEGSQQIAASLSGIDASSVFAVIYLALIATLLGYSLWSRLLSPFGGLGRAVLITCAYYWTRFCFAISRRRLSVAQIVGAVLVKVGLAVNVFGSWFVQRLRRLVDPGINVKATGTTYGENGEQWLILAGY